eukprot:gene9821-2143_t
MQHIGQILFDVVTKTFTIQLVQAHGYVLAVGLLVYCVHLYLSFGHVMSARIKYGIKYPLPYESPNDKGECKTPFNLYQRGHMNFVENLTVFYFLYVASGLIYPTLASICGVVWAAGRVVYAVCYARGSNYRYFGEFYYLSETVMAGAIGYAAYQILTL